VKLDDVCSVQDFIQFILFLRVFQPKKVYGKSVGRNGNSNNCKTVDIITPVCAVYELA